MAIWTGFQTPADIIDFPDDSVKQAQLQALWTQRVSGFTNQAILGSPWQTQYASYQDYYVNPLGTDIPATTPVANVAWTGMPARIGWYFPDLPNGDRWSLANTGYKTDGSTFGTIPKDPCKPDETDQTKYGPYGPRGWQDEYCEWSTTYDDRSLPVESRKILRIDFTCENPEYWNTLWSIDPDRVVQLYNETLNWVPPGTSDSDRNVHKVVTLDDLTMTDPDTGAAVIDPFTGLPAYNPLNPFNSGPAGDPTSGGAMHLTATPNTLQTELGLAGGATVQREQGNTNTQALICCSQYGQPHRNSDPHIGQNVNLVVSKALKATLANPPGLYLQTPLWPSPAWVKFPDGAPQGAKLEDFFHVVRGTEALDGPDGTPMASNFYLHCVFEVPKSLGFCVSDIQIMDDSGAWYPASGARIAELLRVQINALALAADAPAPQYPCTRSVDAAPQPLQILYADVWTAAYRTPVPNVVGYPMTLASNTVIIPPRVKPGQEVDLVLTYTARDGYGPIVTFVTDDGTPSGDATVVSYGTPEPVTYAVPGNTYPSANMAVTLRVAVSSTAAPAVLGLRLAGYAEGDEPPAAPAFLTIADA